MKTFFTKLAHIGVSEFIVLFLFIVCLPGVIALSTNVNFHQIIAPPPPPEITAILGDASLRAVLVIGKSSLPTATVRVYAFSQPTLLETSSDSDGIFYAVFTSDVLSPGVHEFTASTALNDGQSTDPSPHIAVRINDDYTIEAVRERTSTEVKIGNADAATSELLRAIIRNQNASRAVSPNDVPRESANARRAALIQTGLLLLVVTESALLLFQRARRKKREHQGFFHLGKGWYPLVPSGSISTSRRPQK